VKDHRTQKGKERERVRKAERQLGYRRPRDKEEESDWEQRKKKSLSGPVRSGEDLIARVKREKGLE